MADAPSSNIANIPGNIDVVAGYVTGTPDIQWTAADWARFPGIPHVTIDQGYQSPPITTAVVRDVEPHAWTPLAAVVRSNWTAARPTIYCDLYDLTRPGGVLAFGWQGDLWLAMPGWQPGQNLPVTPGCTVVAVQNQQNTIDMSVVLDPSWPEVDVNNGWHFIQGASGKVYLLDGGKMSHIGNPADVAAITNGQPVSAACEAQLLLDFPPGDPTVTVGNVTFPTYTVTPNP